MDEDSDSDGDLLDWDDAVSSEDQEDVDKDGDGDFEDTASIPKDILEDDTIPAVHGAASDKELSKFFVDSHRLIRIGKQLILFQAPVLNMEKKAAYKLLKQKICTNYKATDAKFKGYNLTNLKDDVVVMANILKRWPIDYKDMMVKGICNYSSIYLSWVPGAISVLIESIQRYVISGRQLAYHSAPNIYLIASSLNFDKKGHPPIILPILATWLKASDKPDFIFQKSK